MSVLPCSPPCGQADELGKNRELCVLFGFPALINEATAKVDAMKEWMQAMR